MTETELTEFKSKLLEGGLSAVPTIYSALVSNVNLLLAEGTLTRIFEGVGSLPGMPPRAASNEDLVTWI